MDELELTDSRVEFMAVYILKTLKQKSDKWLKMYAIEDNKVLIQDFLDKNEQNLLVFILNTSGSLIVQYNYPNQLKAKAIYFSKKSKEAVPKDIPMKEAVVYGDLSYSPLDQLSAILDEV
jgi:dynein heavy chain